MELILIPWYHGTRKLNHSQIQYVRTPHQKIVTGILLMLNIEHKRSVEDPDGPSEVLIAAQNRLSDGLLSDICSTSGFTIKLYNKTARKGCKYKSFNEKGEILGVFAGLTEDGWSMLTSNAYVADATIVQAYIFEKNDKIVKSIDRASAPAPVNVRNADAIPGTETDGADVAEGGGEEEQEHMEYDGEKLQDDWIPLVDDDSGDTYFYNTKSGDSIWEAPLASPSAGEGGEEPETQTKSDESANARKAEEAAASKKLKEEEEKINKEKEKAALAAKAEADVAEAKKTKEAAEKAETEVSLSLSLRVYKRLLLYTVVGVLCNIEWCNRQFWYFYSII